MNKNKFDMVMDYIDANVFYDPESIKKGIINEIGYNSHTFGKCFLILTGETLFHYIAARRLYFAAKELYDNPNKRICEIALDCGYSEQSAFTRAMKAYCGCTPVEIRKGTAYVPNNKYHLEKICKKAPDTRTQKILNALENDEHISSSNWELFLGLEESPDEYGFDIDTCYQIADLAERLEVSVWALMRTCQELVIDEKSDPDYIPPEVEAAIDCGISSYEELDAICAFYQCKYYDLDDFMVEAYRGMNKP